MKKIGTYINRDIVKKTHQRKKVSIIGSGFVGSTCAHWIATKELADVVLLDINKGSAQGKALDLYESCPVEGLDLDIQGTDDYSKTAHSDVVVITAGLPRKPGMSRDNLLSANAEIMTKVCEKLKEFCPKAVFIIVSNPLDAMAFVAKKVLNVPKERILGMAGILDSARFRSFIAEAAYVSVKDVHAFVLGGHGDTMVPMTRYCSIGGVPLTSFLTSDQIDSLVERTRKGGAEIVGLLKTGSAYYAPSASVVQMVEAILKDQKRILPCTAFLQGEYGVNGLFVGVLCQLGAVGLERVIELNLNEVEKEGLDVSIQAVQELTEKLETLKK